MMTFVKIKPQMAKAKATAMTNHLNWNKDKIQAMMKTATMKKRTQKKKWKTH